jgi:two-component system sensor histidine kinase VanS
MKNKSPRIFLKIFTYTMFLVVLICLTAVLLFWRQFLSFYRTEQVRQLSASFQPILNTITERSRTPEEMADIARTFSENNQSFKFKIQEEDGKVLFTTGNFREDEPAGSFNMVRIQLDSALRDQISIAQIPGDQISIAQIPDDQISIAQISGDQISGVQIPPGIQMLREQRGNAIRGNAVKGFILTGYGTQIDYSGLVFRSLLGVLIMFAIAVLGAFIFARKITKPLEDEIIRERTIEENQRLFFSAASHELKTPIAAARALVEGMVAGVGEYKDHHKYLRECLKTLDAQGRLVSEILEIVKLSDAHTDSQAVSLDLAELGGKVLAEYRPLAEQQGLFIQGDFPPVSVKANRNLLQRVLSNVIANAVQNTPKGGTIRIEAVEGKNLRLSITNTGARIPEEFITRLFEPFYRIDTARTRHGAQSGLGLAIVKKALDRMGFPFALQNSNEGVVFWVDLPV